MGGVPCGMRLAWITFFRYKPGVTSEEVKFSSEKTVLL